MIITSHPDFWENALATPLPERFGAAPEEVIAYIGLVNNATGNPAIPQTIIAPADFVGDVREAVAAMPDIVKALLDIPLLGVYFGQGLGSSAVTDVVVSPDGQVIGMVTVLDADAFLERSANEWATWKENSPFELFPGHTLEVQIEEPANDNRKNAIQYLLLHEFGHVLTGGSAFLPDWWIAPDHLKAAEEYAFLPLSWQVTADKKIIPLERDDFRLRQHLAFYGEGKLAGDILLEIYQSLQETSFATAYAATNAYEDFAESFALYVHSILMKKPYEIRIRHHGVLVHQHPGFWNQARSAPKQDFLIRLIGAA